jgi:hypothetical protein
MSNVISVQGDLAAGGGLSVAFGFRAAQANSSQMHLLDSQFLDNIVFQQNVSASQWVVAGGGGAVSHASLGGGMATSASVQIKDVTLNANSVHQSLRSGDGFWRRTDDQHGRRQHWR